MMYELFFAALISLHSQTLQVEIAKTPTERKHGLMGRSELPEGQGMLFIFDEPEILSFWMKNTTIPLSIAFFDTDLRLINKMDMQPDAPPKKRSSYLSAAPAKYALEVPQGWFDKHHIETGDTLEFIQ